MRRVLVLAMALAASLPAGAETLRQILQRNAVPTTGFTSAELDGQFDSGAVAADSGSVVIAYPTPGADQSIGPPLQVVAYDRSTQKLAHRAIAASETSDECFGSVLDIREQDQNILVATHINPSAECTIVLGLDLHVRQTLFAWVVAKLGPHAVLMEEDEVHFAPVHPSRLAVYDLPTGRMQEVYPPDGDPLRAQFSRDLKQHLPARDWCREHDHPCDPSSFDEDISEAVFADDAGANFSFVGSYDATGFGEDAERSIGIRSVLYVFRHSAEGWTYCEREFPAGSAGQRQEPSQGDLKEASRRCTHWMDVKVTPGESPFSGPG